jgi:hypothetical protein
MFPNAIWMTEEEINALEMEVNNLFKTENGGEFTFRISIEKGEFYIEWVKNCREKNYFGKRWEKLKEILRNYGIVLIGLQDCFQHAFDYWGYRGFSGEYHDGYRTLYL